MKKFISLFLAAVLCLSFLGSIAFAEGHSILPYSGAKAHPAYPEARVFLRSRLVGRAYSINDELCMALCDFAALYDVNIRVSVDDEGFTALAEGLTASGESGKSYMTANYRYIFLPNSFYAFGGDVYLPLDALSRIFGVTVNETDGHVDITTKQCRLITGTEDYYKLNMSADYQYWLPRIINIEALDEPMAGKIGVANVIINRVKSDRYPDSIYKVLYDNVTGVQFAPANTGSLKNYTYVDNEENWIASCLCYEGYNTVGESLFFANPEKDGDYWFRMNCILVTTIGRHEFFK